ASGERIYELIDQEETVKDGFYFKDEQINTKTIKIVENPKYPNEFKVGSSITFNTYCKGDYTTKIEFEDKTLKHVGNTYIFNKAGTYTYYEFKKQNVEKDEELIKGNFEFKDVSFRYSEDKPLIDDFNLKVNQGDMVAIVGPTGAGKTTMVNLIMRFYELNGGNILLDSMPTTSYAIDTLRGSIGMVLQDTWLFKGTIKENLLFGDQNATEEEIIQACKEAHIYHFIQTLPGKFDYVLNEDGNNVSQGQRQLLTIARAIISKPKILILDEATSSVDTRTESQIQDALDRIMKNKTSFVIAHRLSTIKNAKLIIVMKKGHIVETGTHKELLEKKGFYADLYNAQFSGVNPMKEQEGDILES
ncbi:MAG: ATP-binding cassette domain-containing protein, partial [Mollicutes bacterium]|nr:ATP-binding cassette domain-containing protein [Mollicutes bacterium]